MNPLNVLAQEVLHSGLVAPISGNTLKLSEPSSPLKEVVLQLEAPQYTLAVRIDKAKVSHLFQSGRGQLKRCDYVICTKIGGQKYLVFIEMKHKEHSGTEIIKQFKGAECLVDYIESVLQRFYGVESLQKYEKRFVLFYKVPIHKRPTIPKKGQRKNNVPEQYTRKVVTEPLPIKWVI